MAIDESHWTTGWERFCLLPSDRIERRTAWTEYEIKEVSYIYKESHFKAASFVWINPSDGGWTDFTSDRASWWNEVKFWKWHCEDDYLFFLGITLLIDYQNMVSNGKKIFKSRKVFKSFESHTTKSKRFIVLSPMRHRPSKLFHRLIRTMDRINPLMRIENN